MAGEWTNVPNNSSYPLIDPKGGTYYDPTFNGADDSFISKFTPTTSTLTQSQNNNTTCSPCNGTATINISCGVSDYNYTWSNGSSIVYSTSSTNTITGLCPGIYSVTVTSNCNQTQTATFNISGTTCNGITANVNSASMCSGNTTCPTLTASGNSGISPYTYSWSTGATTQKINPCPISTSAMLITN